MKDYIKIFVVLFSLGLSLFSDLNPVFANPASSALKDSLQPQTKFVSFTDNLPAGKISLPGKSLIKLADNEIHRNMKADLIGIQIQHRVNTSLNSIDLEITKDFFKANSISIVQFPYEGDMAMSLNFMVENLNFFNSELINSADLQINTLFYSSNK